MRGWIDILPILMSLAISGWCCCNMSVYPVSGMLVLWLLTEITRQPISGVLLSEYSSEPSRLCSKRILQYVSVSSVMWDWL